MSTTFKTIKLFWQSTKPNSKLFWFGIFGAVFGVIFQDIIPPFIVSRTFAKLQFAYASHTQLQLHTLEPYLFGSVASLILGWVLWRLQGFAVWTFEIEGQYNIIIRIFKHLVSQGQSFHANRFGGALVSQTNKIVGGYEKFMDELIWSIVPGVVVLIASISVMTFVAPKFALLLIGIVIIYVAIMTWRIRHQLPYNVREAELESARTAALADAVTNVSAIRAFANEEHELKRFSANANKTRQAYKVLAFETFKNDSISHGMTNGLRITAFVFGVISVVTYHGNVSVLYLAVAYASAVVDRLWIFGRVVRNVNRALGDSAEMTEILDLKPEIKDLETPKKAQIIRGDIIFDGVNFSHQGHSEKLFENLNLHIKSGEKVGLVGPSGGGKTTLTGLLMRFMDIDGGRILIDGHDISKIRQRSLRQRISYVPQEPLMFHRSLQENIRYGDLSASDRVVKATAKLANAHLFVENLPQGYQTLVGERGIKLSGGQRQRVAIARAMLKNAPILVLDEATSALDSESEVLIQDALWKLMEGRTAIVIAHRLSTIQKMDRILVLEDGKIVEQGSHKELLANSGTYAKLWTHQSGGFIDD